MKSFTEYMQEENLVEAETKELGDNTVVLVPKDNHYIVRGIGKNLQRHLRMGEILPDSDVDDLHDMGYTVRYAQVNVAAKQTDKPSGTAGKERQTKFRRPDKSPNIS